MLSREDRRALQSVATQFFVNGAASGSFVPRLPEIRDRIGVDLGTIGLILTLASLGGLAASLLCSRVIHRFGTKRVMTAGGGLLALTLPAIGFSTNSFLLWLAVATMLFFDVFTDVAMNIQGSAISTRRSVPVMNRLHGLWSLGTVVGGVIASALAAAGLDLRLHLLGVSVLLVATLFFVAPGLLRSDVAPHAAVTQPSTPPSTTGRSPKNALVVLAVLGAAAMMLEAISGDWASFRLRDDLGADAGVAGLGYVAFTVGMLSGRLSGDSILTRVGEHRLIRAATTLAAAGLGLALLVPFTTSALAGFFIAGLGISVLFPQLYDQAAKSPGRAGAGLASLTAGARLGALIAPGIVGILASTEAFGVGAAMAIVTLPTAAAIIALRTLQARSRPAT